MNDKLLPCPFCGGEATIRKDDLEGWYQMGCSTDYCPGQTITCSIKKDRIKAWNTRTDPQSGNEELIGRIECAIDAIENSNPQKEHIIYVLKRCKSALTNQVKKKGEV